MVTPKLLVRLSINLFYKHRIFSSTNIHHPDNSKRRKTVINYQAKFCRSFKDFKGSWNELCTSFNNAIQNAKKDCVLRLLEYDQDSHNALNEIKEVLENTKSKVPRIEHDIIGIKDLEGAFKKMNLETIRELKIVLDITVGLLTGTVLISVFMASMIDSHRRSSWRIIRIHLSRCRSTCYKRCYSRSYRNKCIRRHYRSM